MKAFIVYQVLFYFLTTFRECRLMYHIINANPLIRLTDINMAASLSG